MGVPVSDELETALQFHGRLRAFGGEIFDGLGLVEDNGLPFDLAEELRHLLLLQ